MISPLLLCISVIIVFIVAYRWYGRYCARVWEVDPQRPTPAHTLRDGIDYVPARNWMMLFGHHFASIAGAGPIVGPVIACALWGWGPATLWVVIGSIFIGGVHDFSALMLSLRHEGNTIPHITAKVMSKRARSVFLLFVWITLVLVVAVFILFSAQTYINQPEIVVPSVGLIGVALIIGRLLYAARANQVLITIMGLVMLIGLMVAGQRFPIDLGDHALTCWMIILIIYSYSASITPVQVLLQPRDYLSSFLLFFGVIAGLGGIIITRPVFHLPMYTAWNTAIGPVWPMLFVTVACGAISGFHALISSGTTVKQLASERHAVRITFGGMLLEGVVAIIAIIAIAAGLSSTAELNLFIRHDNPIGAFGAGFGALTKPLFGVYGHLIAITLLNAFVLTTLDTATRIGRYLSEELFHIKNRFLSTIPLLGVAAWLALSGEWKRLWPTFGAANQLVGALALIVASSYLMGRKKPVLFVLIPTVIMLLTACGALVYNLIGYALTGRITLSVVSCILLILAVFMVAEGLGTMRMKKHQIGV